MEKPKKQRNEKGHFAKGNKVAKKWTEEKALELANNLISWLNEKDEYGNDKGNMFYKYFLIQNDLYDDLVRHLCNKYTRFYDLIKKAKSIQEQKLAMHGVADRTNATMTIFVLKNLHGWNDKKEVKNYNENKEVDNFDYENVKKIIEHEKDRNKE